MRLSRTQFAGVLSILFVSLGLCALGGCDRSDATASTGGDVRGGRYEFGGAGAGVVHRVSRESINDRVLMGGVVRPSDVIQVRNTVGYGAVPPLLLAAGFTKDPAQLIHLIEEGTRVKKGDLLYELRSDNLEVILMEREFYMDLIDLALTEWNGKAKVAKLQGEASMMAAKKNEEFAKYDLVKYQEGDGPAIQQMLEGYVVRTAARYEQAKAELKQSQKLYANGYISSTDLESDRLMEEERGLASVNAQSQLNLFVKYSFPRRVLELERSIAMRQSEYNMAKMVALSELGVAQSIVTYNEFKRDLRILRLVRIRKDISDTKMYAPADGQVIYAKSNGGGRAYYYPPIEEGSSVYKNEQIIHLISSDRMHVEAMLMEMDLDAVKVGQRVEVKVESAPDRVYEGRVEKIDYLATQGSVYLNPDLRQYKVRISLEGDTSELHPGMNALAEVLVNRVEDVAAVPIEAVKTVVDGATGERKHVVTLLGVAGAREVEVELGIRDAFVVEVVRGVSVGDEVLVR